LGFSVVLIPLGLSSSQVSLQYPVFNVETAECGEQLKY